MQIVPGPETLEEVQAQLVSMTARARGYQTSLHQAEEELASPDHALAGLMAANQARLTVFAQARDRELVASAGRRVRLKTYAPQGDAARATSKVVAVFEVTNNGPDSLDLSSVSALKNPGQKFVRFPLRAQPEVIPPGGQGNIAVVLDRASFEPGGTGKITLDFSSKHGSAGIQLSADLVMEDFMVKEEPSSWWHF